MYIINLNILFMQFNFNDIQKEAANLQHDDVISPSPLIIRDLIIIA